MGFITGLTAKVITPIKPSDTTISIDKDTVVTSGRMLLETGQKREWISFSGKTAVSGGFQLTGVSRDLSTTESPATSQGGGTDRVAGTSIKLVAMHDQIDDPAGDSTVTGEKTFASIDVGKYKGPIFATTTDRDTAYPSPQGGEEAYVVGVGKQIYNPTTTQRETNGVGTPPPLATETNAGLVELTTQAQYDAGTDTDGSNPLVAKPSQIKAQFDSVNTDIANKQVNKLVSEFTIGEDITAPAFLRFGLGAGLQENFSGVGATNGSNLGTSYSSTSYQEVSSPLYDRKLESFTVRFNIQFDSHAQTVACQVRQSDGVTIIANAQSSKNIAHNALLQTFTFTNLQFLKGVTYRVYFLGENNNMGTRTWSNGNYPHGNSGFSGRDLEFTMSGIYYFNDEQTNKLYKAYHDQYFDGTLLPVSHTSNNLTTDEVANCTTLGQSGGYTGLERGEIYYLQDNGTIGLTPGTVEVKLGKAISDTEILYNPN